MNEPAQPPLTARIVAPSSGDLSSDLARVAMTDLAALDLVPGDLLCVANTLVLPVLPGTNITAGDIALPHQAAAKHGLAPGQTVEIVAAPGSACAGDACISFGDVGGLGPDLARLREMVELPLVRPDLFAQLGIAAPRGVLMHGPPGCGKTLIARALAQETNAAFFQIAGPEIADKHFGASEARLREVFDAARSAAPTIIFIDEIDSIAPARDGLSGDKQAERRMVAQLLTLMDGLEDRGDVIVLAATNLPDLLDPALRRPGRFDREIMLNAPTTEGRAEILAIHTRAMPLAADVDLDVLAARTPGFVGADLASLVREAGMAALRRVAGKPVGPLSVSNDDFLCALTQVRPSALRALEVEVPQTAWSDIAGAEEAKAALQQAIEWPLRYGAHYQHLGLKAPSGILLYGPPGTGKTLLGRALANAAEANFIAVNAGELLSMYLGESERAIRNVFARARASAPSVIFFDELDALAPRRASGISETSSRVVAQLLTQMDGLSNRPGIFVLGATNQLDQIDPAILRPGRFDLKIPVDLPEEAERYALLTLYFCGDCCAGLDLSALAQTMSGYSGADIAELARSAKQCALARTLREDAGAPAGAVSVTTVDIETARAAMERAAC
ncbi:MAG: AAA family ATPase [Pseudomonadota bacterium]